MEYDSKDFEKSTQRYKDPLVLAIEIMFGLYSVICKAVSNLPKVDF